MNEPPTLPSRVERHLERAGMLAFILLGIAAFDGLTVGTWAWVAAGCLMVASLAIGLGDLVRRCRDSRDPRRPA